jgi:V/A-type H+/Na+-transporting ATPase subunit D
MRNIAPTKTNLLKTSEEIKLAHLGYELLDQKRNILIIELLTLIDQASDHQALIEKSLVKAFSFLEESVLDMGKLNVLSLSSAIHMKTDISLKQRRVMGVILPVVETEFTDNSPYFSPLGTSFKIEETISAFRDALKIMGKLAELKVSIMRLAREVKKTIRKVNALEKIAIPDLQETIRFIKNRLEENERDMLILMKQVKSRLEAKRRESN